jgi:hypothetical protein
MITGPNVLIVMVEVADPVPDTGKLVRPLG